MPYKTLLMHLDDTEKVPTSVKFAAQLANKSDAHITGLVTETVGRINHPDVDFQNELDNMAEKASRFEVFCEKHGVNSYEAQIMRDDPIDSLIQYARHSDLVVLNQPSKQSDRRVVESILLDAGKPCLFIPYIGSFDEVGKNIMLAWDGSREAARAAADALPLLCSAESVEVVIINGGTGRKNNSDTIVDTEIAKYLARHAVNVEVKEIVSDIDIGNTLLSHAADSGADLCVMGAYGHTRVREWIWGGATRTVLDTMTIPVLMSH